jgi:hypothetical protein
VRRLGTLLRQANIPVQLDQFFLDDHPAGPNVGWPKWCEDSANESRCVLIVASEGWFAAYDKTGEPGTGLGAAAEADLIRQSLYDDKGDNDRIRLAFVHPVAVEKVPVRLRSWHQFQPFGRSEHLDQLIQWLAGSLGFQHIQPPTVRWPEPNDFRADIADRHQKEWPAIVQLLAGGSRERILLIEGGSGVGKSELVRQAKAYAKNLGLPVVTVNFKGGVLDTEGVLGNFDLDLGDHLPNFSRERPYRTHLLRKDLRALRRPVLLIFDSYESAADNTVMADWINQQLLAEIETSLALAAIVAGQKVPNSMAAGWRDLARHLVLGPITELEPWKQWAAPRYPRLEERDLVTLLRATKGLPSLMATLCANFAEG